MLDIIINMKHPDFRTVFYELPIEDRTILFNGEQWVAFKVCLMLRLLLDRLDYMSSKIEFQKLFRIYQDAYSTSINSMNKTTLVKRKLLRYYPEYVNEENVYDIVAFVLFHSNNPILLLNNKDITVSQSYIRVIKQTSSIFRTSEQDEEKNDLLINQYVEDQDYGIVSIKPIYCDGVLGIQEYLSSLELEDSNEILIWNRTGPYLEKCINGSMDVYQSNSKNGKIYKLFINKFANKTSTYPPRGFSLINLHKKELSKLNRS